MVGDVVRRLGLDRPARHLPGAATKDLGPQDFRRRHWDLKCNCRIVLHAAHPVALGTGAIYITPRIRRPFLSLKLQHLLEIIDQLNNDLRAL